jgi:hypothetical protein
MDQNRIDEIVATLRANDTAAVPFVDTKAQLLQKGYREVEIVQALYQFPYDGKPNPVPDSSPVQEYFEKNPEAADRLAKSLLREIKVRDAQEAAAYMLASSFGDKQASSYFSVLAADKLGFLIYTVLGILLIAGIISIRFNVYDLFYAVASFILGIWVLYLIAKKFWSVLKHR